MHRLPYLEMSRYQPIVLSQNFLQTVVLLGGMLAVYWLRERQKANDVSPPEPVQET